jgi:hypothetical protein
MDYLPEVTGLPRERRVRFYVYDAEAPGQQTSGNQVPGGLIPGLRLDSDDRLNPDGVKFIRNCMSCHGGRFNQGEIQGATFLDFDLSLFVFGDDAGRLRGALAGAAARAEEQKIRLAVDLTRREPQLDALRRMNAMVLRVVQATGAQPIADRIFRSYVNPGRVAVGPIDGASYAFLPERGGAYVPEGWPATVVLRTFTGQQVTARQFYLTAVRKYCTTCHFSQQTGFNLQTRQALTFFDFGQYVNNPELPASPHAIRQVVCGASDMPHAEVTRDHFRRDAAAVSLLCNGCNLPVTAPPPGECRP